MKSSQGPLSSLAGSVNYQDPAEDSQAIASHNDDEGESQCPSNAGATGLGSTGPSSLYDPVMSVYSKSVTQAYCDCCGMLRCLGSGRAGGDQHEGEEEAGGR